MRVWGLRARAEEAVASLLGCYIISGGSEARSCLGADVGHTLTLTRVRRATEG